MYNFNKKYERGTVLVQRLRPREREICPPGALCDDFLYWGSFRRFDPM